MSNFSFSNIDYVLVGTGSLAALGLITGARALVNPPAYAIAFGLPLFQSAPSTAKSKSDAVSINPFIPAVGGRNVSGALTLLTFIYLGDKRAVGVTLAAGIATGLTDAVTCYKYGQRNEAYGHGAMSLFCGGLGVYLLWGRNEILPW